MVRYKIGRSEHLLCVGFMVVIVSLLIILGLQYRSLSALESASAAAIRGMVRNYLDAVAAAVEHFYRADAERALHIAPEAFTPDEAHRPRSAFHTSQAAKLFFTAFTQHRALQLRFYHPTGAALAVPPPAATVRAVKVALAPWWMLSSKGTMVEPGKLSVDERDPEHRMILKPLTDDASRVIGIIGMIVDLEFFTAHYLPKVIQEYLPKFCSEKTRENLVVTVHDGSGELVWATQPVLGPNQGLVKSPQFLFTDWRLGTRSRYVTPEQWARKHFAINVSLSVLVTGVLIAGIVLTLRTAARAVKLSQMKTDFVSNVSHELRTPLASIRVFGEFLRLGRVAGLDKTREYGEYIETESRRLTQLINNILDFSKIESEQKTYHFGTADVREILIEVMKTFDVRLQQRQGKLIFDASGTPVSPAVIDADAIAQAVTNLLDNAVKYSELDRDIHVRLRQQGEHMMIAVSDQGIGIPHKEQARIFERFHRVSTGLVHNVKGSGLGLAIVKHIVEAHRGKVTLESEPGQGSTFTIHLPVHRGSELQEQSRTLAHDASPDAAWRQANLGRTL